MNGRALAAMLVGAALVAALLTRLPVDVFRATQAVLFAAAAAVLLLVAGAMLLRPARKVEAALFGLPLEARGPLLGLPPERQVRIVLRPLVAAAVAFGIAVVAGALRGV